MNNQRTPTPFEQAALKRQEGAKRLAGIIIIQQWIERKRQLRDAQQTMNPLEKVQWDMLILNATLQQTQHFGFDA